MEYLKDAVIREDTTTPGLQAAREKLAYMSMTEQEQREYREYMVSVHAARDAWDTAIDEAKAEGHAKGRAEGRVEGRTEEKLENARKMKAKGFAIEDIAEITGLTAEEII